MIPDINAQSEKLFCAAWRIKMYLHAAISEQCLNHLMLLLVHKTQTDALGLVDIANSFISGHDHRKHVFGNDFKPSDLVHL